MNNFLCYACVLVHLRGYERLKTSSFAAEFLQKTRASLHPVRTPTKEEYPKLNSAKPPHHKVFEIMESETFSSQSFQNHRKQNRKDFRGEGKKRDSKK